MKVMLDANTCIAIIRQKPPQALRRFRAYKVGEIGIAWVTLATNNTREFSRIKGLTACLSSPSVSAMRFRAIRVEALRGDVVIDPFGKSGALIGTDQLGTNACQRPCRCNANRKLRVVEPAGQRLRAYFPSAARRSAMVTIRVKASSGDSSSPRLR